MIHFLACKISFYWSKIMHPVLSNICAELDKVAAAIQSNVSSDEPLNVAHNNWSFPGLTRSELIERVKSITDEIREHSPAEIGHAEPRLADYPRRLVALRNNTIPQLWGNAQHAVPALLETLTALSIALKPILASKDLTEKAREALLALKRLNTKIRTIEATLTALEPRSTILSTMIERIESAHEAADQLPVDLEALSEAHNKIVELSKQAEDALELANKEKTKIESLYSEAQTIDAKLRKNSIESDAVVKKAEMAYSAATSQGLAAAFAERSRALDFSMRLWVIGLVGALVAGSFFGYLRFQELANSLNMPTVSDISLVINLVLSFFSIGAPIWFAWIATKQIGQCFRLSEDYAFKASVSRAYEGYRKEAARVDDMFEESALEPRLLASALTRLDEQPLRLVETATHGSPWQELLASEAVRDAIKNIPDFGQRVIDMARISLSKPNASAPNIGKALAPEVKPE
ncbi:hypothetical protein V6B08_19915 [Ferrovibrio sp. MS7]|uniref:hypothetical protein n=1 Tax=Ferrovibrio plantarum TaxID=3119164 RepID=UPI003135B6AC